MLKNSVQGTLEMESITPTIVDVFVVKEDTQLTVIGQLITVVAVIVELSFAVDLMWPNDQLKPIIK